MAAVDTVKGRYSSYKLLNDVGRGGSARVYCAQDLATKKKVAVKQLFGNRAQDREDWLREVDALNTLNNHHCPHVVQYLDHMQQHDKLFLVEEYAEHGSLLRQLRQNGPMSEDVVCRFVFQILTTLHRMSQWNIIHGDVKASNVLLFDAEVVKLTDFALRSRGEGGAEHGGRGGGGIGELDNDNDEGGSGSVTALGSTTAGQTFSVDGTSSESRLTDSATPQRTRATTGAAAAAVVATVLLESSDESGTRSASAAEKPTAASSPPPPLAEFRGSVYWAAPEVLAGESSATAASDIWAVACTAIELLTGEPPYFDRSIPNATHHVLKSYYAVMEGAKPPAQAGTNEKDSATDSAAVAGAEQSPPNRSSEHTKHNASLDPQKEDVERGSGHADGVGDDTDPSSLMPPLPETLHLSEECRSFLRLCLCLRPAERASAGQLLQHPWFWDVVVPQLLQAAREGRGVVGGSPGEDDGGSNNSNNASSGTNAGAGGSRFAVIEKWVESNLLGDEEARCKAWLEGDALSLLVPVLTPRIMTPKYIGNVMRCFSHFAEANSALAPLFLNRLGATELWSVEELTSACDADHLVTLFRRCCEAQDPQVAVFTPTHPSALRFVLGLEKAKVQESVVALHRLLVEDAPPQQQQQGTPSTNVAANTAAAASSGDHIEPAELGEEHTTADAAAPHPDAAAAQDAARQRELQQQQRRERARERLLLDGGAAMLCHRVESQCKAAFLAGVPPTLEWSTINYFLEILETVEPLPGGQALLWGVQSGDGGELLNTKSSAAGTASGASVTTPRGDGAMGNNNTNVHSVHSLSSIAAEGSAAPPLASPRSATPRESLSPMSTVLLGPHVTLPAATAAATSSNVVNNVNGAAGTHNVSSSNIGNASFSAHADVEWTSSLSWMLAVQESAHHCCTAAVRLLLRYVPLAAEVKAEYVDKAGVSLTATLVLVASSAAVSTELRGAAVGCLPKLQSCSLRAARYLRDPIRCIPLLAMTLKQSASVPLLTTSMLAALRALTVEKQTFAACVGSPWVWDALTTLLKEVEAQGSGSKASNDKSAGKPHPDGIENGAASANSPSPPLSLGEARNAEQRRLRGMDGANGDDGSHSSDQKIASRAMLADIVALIAQWFADASPTALLSMATAAAAVHRSMALSSPTPPQPPPSSSVSLPPATTNNATSRSISLANPASPPSLPALLQRLRVQLTQLSHNEGLCNGDMLQHVDKALEFLMPLDLSVPVAAVPAK
ncbi:putative protein kinase [Leptomonas pyrrhocoris]|uniref:non-specific serine/threonine protein kinase n=1 Tax=Leptomonas pyrrhocoris TaxID=157538 RepID=A0A0N0DTY0_LEPPY|nr:putative protein kinase [Leptomonas pyrrhocoris]KPA78138.1 putative protein kinase [Leptomonas pyrrhocoris]|eukprot:XP_015656577.1 putative protein kinase [Leptomonas pyrrhocoris]